MFESRLKSQESRLRRHKSQESIKTQEESRVKSQESDSRLKSCVKRMKCLKRNEVTVHSSLLRIQLLQHFRSHTLHFKIHGFAVLKKLEQLLIDGLGQLDL
jgi:hypothetical protein